MSWLRNRRGNGGSALARATAAALASLIIGMPMGPRPVRAQDSEGERETLAPDQTVVDPELIDAVGNAVGPGDLDEIDPEVAAAIRRSFDEASAPADSTGPVPTALPSGQAKTAVTPQAIPLPSGEGSIEGMGESFSPQLSSGTASFSVPIAVPSGRAGVQPDLTLSYSSAAGNGPVGVGWSLATPFIARQSDRGLPRYLESDDGRWHPDEDTFFFNGGQELVPVDSAAMEEVDCAHVPGCRAPVPLELQGWQQYRARVEGRFMRFFRGPENRRWVVHDKNGTRYDFGHLPTGTGPTEAVSGSARALQTKRADGTGPVYRWLLTRMTDSHGSTVYYLYDADLGQRYLRHIYYDSPARDCGSADLSAGGIVARMECQAPLDRYGRHIELRYESRPDLLSSYASTWEITTGLRLARVDISAAEGRPGARTMARRYHFSYARPERSFLSLLNSVQQEGRPAAHDASAGVMVGDPTVAEGDDFDGEKLPPLRFDYSRQPTTGEQAVGFGGVSSVVHRAEVSPPHSVEEARSDLFDVNADGLPDLLVTDPAEYTAGDQPAAAVFFNGFEGPDARPASPGTFSDAVALHVPDRDLPSGGTDTWSHLMTLSQANIVPMDIDGNGHGDLLHMPRRGDYGWFSPLRNGDADAVSPADQGWEWIRLEAGAPVDSLDRRIDFRSDASTTRAFDVNNDHLVDVVQTTGTSVLVWLNLGWLPGGEGHFGSYAYADDGELSFSSAPIETCLYHDGRPLDFSDPEVRIADMNGDGIQDIAKVKPGDVIYWPGRGEGVWGVGDGICDPAAPFLAREHIRMGTPPRDSGMVTARLSLADVNGDGASDAVQVQDRFIQVWFNEAGLGFTDDVLVRGAPPAPDYASPIRFADIDGSGTLDVVYGNAYRWEWVDFMGGQRPRLLTVVDNGLGAQTELTYGSSTEDYLADLRDAYEGRTTGVDRFTWNRVSEGCDANVLEQTGTCAHRPGSSPVVSAVVRSMSVTDRFDAFGREAQYIRTTYAYHDAYYEGIEQEFRGFGAADVRQEGDWSHPTSLVRTHFHQGRRPGSLGTDRHIGNPHEALKGRPFLRETLDLDGRYLSTHHSAYTLRTLTTGLNGIGVSYAYVRRNDELRYDNAPFDADGHSVVQLPTIVQEDGYLGTAVPAPKRRVVVRGQRYSRILSTRDAVDNVGSVRVQRARGRPGVDEAIGRLSISTNLADSATSWLWRARRTYITGEGVIPGDRLADTSYEYNAAGDRTRVEIVVERPETYDFGGSHPSSENVLAGTKHDEWGNTIAHCDGSDDTETFEGCLQVRGASYDPDYNHFPAAETVMAGFASADGVDFLTATAAWNRGIDSLRSTRDFAGHQTLYTHDGLGRLTSVIPPAAAGCAEGRPSTRIEYSLTSDRVSRPVSLMRSTTERACDGPLGADALVRISYVDGLGRVRAVLANAEDDGEWIRSSVRTFDRRGATRRAYQSDRVRLDPDTLDAALALPPVPYQQARYDAFGRGRALIAEDGAETWASYHSVSTDVCDPLDLQAGGPIQAPAGPRGWTGTVEWSIRFYGTASLAWPTSSTIASGRRTVQMGRSSASNGRRPPMTHRFPAPVLASSREGGWSDASSTTPSAGASPAPTRIPMPAEPRVSAPPGDTASTGSASSPPSETPVAAARTSSMTSPGASWAKAT